jgi:hypothetical protein
MSGVHSFTSHYSSFIPSYFCQLHPQQMGKGLLSTTKSSVSIFFLSILKRNSSPVLISTKLQPPHLSVAKTPRLRLVEIGYSESPRYHHNISRLERVTASFQFPRRKRFLQHLRRASTVRHLVLLHFPFHVIAHQSMSILSTSGQVHINTMTSNNPVQLRVSKRVTFYDKHPLGPIAKGG